MALTAMRVPTVFTAVDRFSQVVSRMTGNVSAFGQTAQAAAMRTSRRMNSLGTDMLYSGAVMAVGIGYAINEATKYEKAIASLGAVTGTQVGSMNKDIEGLSRETKRSAVDIAKSFEIVGSKMSQYLTEPENLRKITRASILMADAAGMELEPAIDSLTGVLNIFGKSAEDANYIVNKLSAGEIVGSISIAETADILRQFGGTARLANVEVDESVALIQALTKSLGVEGVGRGIRNLMTDLNMVGAFDKNKTKALQQAGVNMDILGDKSLDLVTRLSELKKLEKNSAAMGLFFKKTGIQTGATLFQNFEDYNRFLKAIKETNQAEEQAAKNNATLAKGWKDLMAQIQLLAIKIGGKLLPKLNGFIDYIIPIIEKTAKWAENNEKLIKAVFYLTIGVLALGVALKIGAFFMLSYSRVLMIIELATKAYTGALWLMSLGLEGAATATIYATASLWAFLWPLALIGLAVWAVIDMVQHWEDWHDIIALCVGPLGWVYLLLDKIIKHSDDISNKFVFEGWGGGIKAIGIMLEDLILSPLIGIFNIMGRLTSFIPGVGSSFKEMAADLDASRTKIAPELFLGDKGMQGATNFQTFGGVQPTWDYGKKDNLAGGNSGLAQEIAKAMGLQTMNINVNDPQNVLKSVEVNGSEKSGGLAAYTGNTTGNF